MHTLDYEYTDKDISPWGGLRLVQELYERIGMRKMIEGLDLPEKGSNRGYDSARLIEGFIVSVLLGAKRLSHSGTIGNDQVISKFLAGSRGWLLKAHLADSSGGLILRRMTNS